MHRSKLYAHNINIAILTILACTLIAGCGGAGQLQQTSTVTAPAESASNISSPYTQNIDIDLSSSSTINPEATFTISNHSDHSILMPAVFLNGNSALNRSSILYAFQSLSDEQFALATWQFVVDNTQHFCAAGAPGDPGSEAVEPLRLMNGYGYMCCDQASRVLNWLWQGAGYQSRIVSMSFHVVPEIYYEGAWHMFDSDHRVYYLEPDNQTVASVADVIANPSLVAQTADANGYDPVGTSAEWMAEQYATSSPSYSTIDYSVAQTYSLQPGQSFSINAANNSPAFLGVTPEPTIPNALSASFDWSLDYSDPNWSNLSVSQSGVTPVAYNSSVFLVNSTRNRGFIVYPLSSPFPVISLQVSGLVNVSSNSTVNAYFSTDNASWSTAFPLTAESSNSGSQNPIEMSANLSSAASGQYNYFVKIELVGDGLYAAQIANPHIVSVVQDSVSVFPPLVPGQVNHLVYQDWSLGSWDHNVTVSFAGQ